MIRFEQKGDFSKTERMLKKDQKIDYFTILDKFGQIGADALAANTPVRTGLTANSWGYEIVKNKGSYAIYWTNSNIRDGVPIAVILQYGHATRNGGFVQGRDYINPAIQPIFDMIANDAWREVCDR